MADELRIDERPALEHPVLVAAFRGWNDGGQGASLAGAFLARAWAARRFGEIDPEGFYDFQATRPTVSLVDGEHAPDRLAGEHFLHRAACRVRGATRSSCSASSRTCAGARSPRS